MRITVDTSHDSHEDIKKVIKMLRHLVGDSQEIFTNQPEIVQEISPIANIFGDMAPAANSETAETTQESAQESAQETTESSESTEDLFAELFSEEELKKMDTAAPKSKEEEEDEEEEIKPKAKDKKYGIEFY